MSYHEASHSCLAWVLGCEVQRLVVGRNLTGDESFRLRGQCHWRAADGGDILPEVRLRISLAGPVADARMFGRPSSPYDGDERVAREDALVIAARDGGDVDEIIDHARWEVALLIARNAAAIEALAGELRQSRWMEMDGKAAIRVLMAMGARQTVAERGGGGKSARRPPEYAPATKTRQRTSYTPAAGVRYEFERRDGRDVATRKPDPSRATTSFMRRLDGVIG